ncbi:hypothetical protein F444_20593 [Phytophthora nicotianae P1976]|uniref:Uncharacterized protein n=1 Tax=Phytophthora nicotianae P1976 TaxID=1317066 RepID=A0A080Z435_PHYNI|nr:hypothetical protein F444_20593 [Phytophthora nicotianae P1976]
MAFKIEHYIDADNKVPILQKRREQTQTEDKVVDRKSDKMMNTCVIEEGNKNGDFL